MNAAPTSTSARVAPARCDARERARIVREAQRLGVPHDYGLKRGLRLIAEPQHLMCVGDDVHGRGQWLSRPAAHAYARMRAAAAREHVELQLVSAFRSAAYQLGIVQRKLERGQTIDEILRVSAAPGYSEHHSGRVVDLTTPGYVALEEEFEHSPAYAWLGAHAHEFGYALSYPRDNPHGIAYEPWHWCWRRKKSPA